MSKMENFQASFYIYIYLAPFQLPHYININKCKGELIFMNVRIFSLIMSKSQHSLESYAFILVKHNLTFHFYPFLS